MSGTSGRWFNTILDRRLLIGILCVITLLAGSFGNVSSVSAFNGGTYNGYSYPSTCTDVHTNDPSAIDGQYTILANGKLLDVYCKDLATAPKEYITLVNTQNGYNFSSYVAGGAAQGPGVRTYYTKIRLDPANLAVITYDYMYASYDPNQYIIHEQIWYQIPYAVARDCYGANTPQGLANINLLGTGFSVVANQFYPWQQGTSSYSASNQIVDITGGGYCGWNAPGNDYGNYAGGLLNLNLLSAPAFITSVTSHVNDGTFVTGNTIPVLVTFSDAVHVTGTPQLTLNTGSILNYTGGSGTNTLEFEYTVASGDTSVNLNYSSTSALALNSGSITDLSNNAVALTLPATNSPVSLGGSKAIVIDTGAPAAPVISATPSLPTNGDVTVTISFPTEATLRQYKIGTGAYQNYTGAFSISDNDTITAKGTNTSTNVSSEASLTISNIDKIAPVISGVSNNGTYNIDVTATISGATNIFFQKWGDNPSTYVSGTPITAEGTYTLSATDDAGNSTSVTFNIDKTAPNAPTLSASTTAPTNGQVTVTITYPGDAAEKKYKIGNGSVLDYTVPFSISVNDTVTAYAVDAAGNQSANGTLTISNIDLVAPDAPTLSASTTAPTNGQVTVTITYPGDAAEKKYKIGNGSVLDYTVPFSISVNDTVTAYAVDAAGNQSANGTLTISNIDLVAPNAPTLSASTTAPTNGQVTVTITYPGDAAEKKYKIGNGSVLDYTVPFSISVNDTVTAYAVDAAGNQSANGTLTISNIDLVAPDAPTLSASTTAPTNGQVTVTITYPGDAAEKKYKIGNGSVLDYTVPFSISVNDTVTAYAVDAAGNQSANGTLTISNIDLVAPDAPTLSVSEPTQTNKALTITISYPSDAHQRKYQINGGTVMDYTIPVTLSANETIIAFAIDEAGNRSLDVSFTTPVSILDLDNDGKISIKDVVLLILGRINVTGNAAFDNDDIIFILNAIEPVN